VSEAATIANKLEAFGGQASQVPLSGHLPLQEAALHQAILQAFVDALHGSFLIAGIALLAVGVLVAFSFKPGQTETLGEAADSQVAGEEVSLS
jgi:phosphohistidine phosphatase SixA